jgi:hypothetical protein
MSDNEQPWQSTIYGLLLHPSRPLVRLESQGGFVVLPSFRMPGRAWQTQAGDVAPFIRRELGLEANVLYRVDCQESADDRKAESVYVLEGRVMPVDGLWVGRPELAALALDKSRHRPLIEGVLLEAESGQIPPLRAPWARQDWYAQAEGWIEAQVSRLGATMTGPMELARSWSISCVMRIPTTRGDLYFKTAARLPLFVNEAVVTKGLAQLYPENVPEPLAIDEQRGWMLLPDFGRPLDWGAPLAQRTEMLRAFARLQIDSAGHIDQLLALGCIDRRLERLAASIDALVESPETAAAIGAQQLSRLRSLGPRLKKMCGRLAEDAIPCALIHGDLHPNNVTVRDGDFVFFDWTDACVGHPFFDMLEIYREEDEVIHLQLRDAYLALWREVVPEQDLLGSWRLGEILAAVHHAVSYWVILANIEPSARFELEHGLSYWLERILSLAQEPAGAASRE